MTLAAKNKLIKTEKMNYGKNIFYTKCYRPLSNVYIETSLSSLKYLKTCLRYTVGEQRLNGLTHFNIQRYISGVGGSSGEVCLQNKKIGF